MADEAVADLLKSWDLESLINVFKDNEIDSASLQSLTEDLIKELIPKIGLRIKFTKNWADHFKSKDSQVLPSDTVSNTGDESDSSLDPAAYTLERQNCFVGKSKFNEKSKKIQSLNVNNLLKSTAAGRCILKCSKNQLLPKTTRKLLVDIIITEALESFSGYRSPVRVDFDDMASQIVKIFPKENKNSYYIPAVKKRSSRIQKSVTSKGKLVDKYRNKLQSYRRLSRSDVSYESSTAESVTSDAVSDEIQRSRLWLEHNREPWDLVLQHWETTAPLRHDNLPKNIETVHSFLEEWPVLTHSNGHTLLELDYKYLHKSDNHNVFLIWDQFFSHLKNSRPVSKESNAKSLLELLEQETLSADCKVVVQLMLLPYLIAPRGRLRFSKKHTDLLDTGAQKNMKKPQWKFSITESQRSMIIHVELAGDLLTAQRQRIEEVSALGLTVQPYIIVVGPALDSIEAFYVSLDSTLYKVPTALKAIDLCFKCFHAVNAQYPPESEHLWYLIQFAVYRVTTKWDKQISYIADIMNSMPEFAA